MVPPVRDSDTATMRPALVPVCLLLIVALGGCASEAPSASPIRVAVAAPKPTPTPLATVTPTPRPTPQPTPTPKPLTKQAAATAYLSVADAFNRTMNASVAEVGAKPSVTGQRTLQLQAAGAAGSFIVGLRKIPFPEADVAAAKALVRQTTIYMKAARAASKARDAATFDLLMADADKAESGCRKLAIALRSALGLRHPPSAHRSRAELRL